VKLDKERLEKYLDQIASETIDLEKIISQKGVYRKSKKRLR
jgi:ribosomal protein S16